MKNFTGNTKITDNIKVFESEKDKLLHELKNYEEYSFPLHENYIREIKINSDFHEKSDQCRQEQADLSRRLKKILSKLNDLESKREKRESAARTLSESEQNLKQKNDDYILAKKELNDEKDKVIEAFYIASHENTEFIIDESMREQIEIAVSEYEGFEIDRNIRNLLQHQRDKLYAKLQELLVQAEHKESTAKQKFDDLSQQLAELKNTSDPVPQRTNERELCRNLLTEKGINYRSFYECIGFKDELNQQERAVIEAKLSDMGLLDALVIPEAHLNKALQLLGNASDSYIIANENSNYPQNKFFTVNAPEELQPIVKTIIALFEEKTTLGTDGFYRNGILAGHSLGKDNACFIGAESRKKFRQKQIEKLTEETNIAESEYDNAKSELNRINKRLHIINEEYSNLPEFADLNTALNRVERISEELKNTEKIYGKNEEKNRIAESEFNKASAEADNFCREFQQYEKTAEFYTEVIDSVDNYYKNPIFIFCTF